MKTGRAAEGAIRDRLASGWLVTALVALGLACLLAVFLVLLRVPGVGSWLSGERWFPRALVLHVDLSLLVWLLALLGGVWAVHGQRRFPVLGWVGLLATLGGLLTILLAGLGLPAEPVLSNYIPVIDSPAFMAGLLAVALGVALSAGRVLLQAAHLKPGEGRDPVQFGLLLLAIGVFAALATFALTVAQLPGSLAPATFYELLFWGGGHSLQFVYLLLLLVAWTWLAQTGGFRLAPTPVYLAFLLALVPLLASPLLAWLYAPDSPQYRAGFTALMRYLSWWGVPVLLIGMYQGRPEPGSGRGLPLAVQLSVAVLLLGFGVGALIRGDTLQVPAHYHGTTGAVNLAMMGWIYRVGERLGWQPVTPGRAGRQLQIYATGLVLLVVGLAWAGSLGVARKVAGEAQGLQTLAEHLAMSLVGVGAAVGLSGCFLFLGNLWRGQRARKRGRGRAGLESFAVGNEGGCD